MFTSYKLARFARLALVAAVVIGLGIFGSLARATAWDDAQAAFAEHNDHAALEALRRSATEGDPRAQLALGLALRHAHLFGGAITRDDTQASHWLDKAAAPTHALHATPAAPVLHADDVPPKKRTRLGLYATPQDVAALRALHAGRMLVIDIRTRAEAATLGMPDAADALVPYMEYDEFMSAWDSERATYATTARGAFADDVARLLKTNALNHEAVLVLICRSGDRSAKAADLLATLGYTQVYSVVEGYEGDLSTRGRRELNGWKNAGLPWSYRLNRRKLPG